MNVSVPNPTPWTVIVNVFALVVVAPVITKVRFDIVAVRAPASVEDKVAEEPTSASAIVLVTASLAPPVASL